MFRFKPILKTLVWGGEKIAPFKGIETTQEHIGESWELSGVAGSESVIDGGPCGIGRESTLIDMSKTPYKILREAALSEATVAQALADDLTLIGITGGSGCGKTTALQELEAYGALILDCDAIYHELLETDTALLRELNDAFPGTVRDGVLDRKALGRIVFAETEKLELLNRISHRHVKDEVNRRLRAFAIGGGRLAAVDAVELISAGLAERCAAVVGILADRTGLVIPFVIPLVGYAVVWAYAHKLCRQP